MARIYFAVFASLVLATPSQAALSCRYAEVDGLAAATFSRPQADEKDWYSAYQTVQFCSRVGEVGGTYVLIQEELIHGFKVTNPPRNVLSIKIDARGHMLYEVADDIDHVGLDVSADRRTMTVTAKRFGRTVVETLRREAAAR